MKKTIPKLLTLVCLLAALMGLSAVTAHAETISGTISGGRNYRYKDEWESVIGNCDTLLFLGGGNEPTSLEFISKLLGKETVHTRTRGQTKGRSGSSSVNFQQTGRDVPYLFVKSSVALNFT